MEKSDTASSAFRHATVPTVDLVRRWLDKLQIPLFFVGSSALFATLLHGKNIPLSQNALYHLRIAELYSGGDFNLSSLGVLKLSSLSGHFFNQHFLYHVFLVPFVLAFDGLAALEVANVVMVGGLATVIALLLRHLGVRSAYFWSLAAIMFFQAGFQRLFWERPEPLTAAFIFASYLLLKARARSRWLFAVAFLHINLSYMALLLLPFVASFEFLQRSPGERRSWSGPACVGIGLLCGFLVSLDPLGNLAYAWALITHHVNWTDATVQVREWMAPADLWRSYAPALLVLVAALGSCLSWPGLINRDRAFLGLWSLVFFLATVMSQRFEHLFALFTAVFALCVLQGIVMARPVLYACLAVAAIWNTQRNLVFLDRNFTGAGDGRYRIEAFHQWFKSSPYKDERFINFKWEYWSQIFSLDPHTQSEPGYSMSIYLQAEPRRFRVYDYMRYKMGKEGASPDFIKELHTQFQARFILVDRAAAGAAIMPNANLFDVVYEDEHFLFYRISGRNEIGAGPDLEIGSEFKAVISETAATYLENPSDPRLEELSRRVNEMFSRLPKDSRSLLESAKVFATIHDRESLKVVGCHGNDPGRRLYHKIVTAVENARRDTRFQERRREPLAENFSQLRISILFHPRPLFNLGEHLLSPQRGQLAFEFVTVTGGSAVLLPEYPLAMAWGANEIMAEMRSKAGRPDENGRLFVWNHLSWAVTPSKKFVELSRGAPVLERLPNGGELKERLNLAVRHLIRFQADDGSMKYDYDPQKSVWVGGAAGPVVELRKMIGVFTLCRARRVLTDPALKREAEGRCERSVTHALRRLRRGGVPDHLGHLATSGLVLLEYLSARAGHQEARSAVERVRAAILARYDEATGSFFTRLLPQPSRDGQTFYPGEALLFLAAYDEWRNRPEHAEIMATAVQQYHQAFLRSPSLYYVRWHAEALIRYSRFLRAEGHVFQSRARAFLDDMAAFVRRRQIGDDHGLRADRGCLGGTDADPDDRRAPDVASGLAFEGFALQAKRGLVSEASHEREKAWLGLLRCALSQQFTVENVGWFEKPHEVLGAFPDLIGHGGFRIDVHAHVTNGLISHLISHPAQ